MNEIKAPCSGKVVRIMVQPGDMVQVTIADCMDWDLMGDLCDECSQ